MGAPIFILAKSLKLKHSANFTSVSLAAQNKLTRRSDKLNENKAKRWEDFNMMSLKKVCSKTYRHNFEKDPVF